MEKEKSHLDGRNRNPRNVRVRERAFEIVTIQGLGFNRGCVVYKLLITKRVGLNRKVTGMVFGPECQTAQMLVMVNIL